MTRRVAVMLLLAGLAGLSGCTQAKKTPIVAYAAAPASPAYSSAPDAAAKLDYPVESVGTSSGQPSGQEGFQLASAVDSSLPVNSRMIIYKATLQMSVVDIEAALTSAQKLCTEAGGYMDALTSHSITLRVPARNFDRVLDDVRKLGQMLSREIRAQDVTEEYVDLRLRLKNAEATRDRLLAILEKAKTVKETLEVERELSRVREEIERIKGRLAFLERETAFSTIHITFSLPAPTQVIRNRPPTPFAWLDALGVERVLQLDR
ncbi:MAG TPA: DUF4349 domain-containing protein [Phycisphaerae bacterium]|mgnify:CR=1 FL=1|jgi:hypothetical protein|nr:DUF4349 domain-containing protein [Phycisphaerae bacterium]HOB74322.1 DUF4349 domain-containing protein [Phycisphaerae bacterium]HOJ53087.1 DUF4349 domain-containing protein [Phycisphaerae bacterium]HOL24824.1 DUF4349 domain-containing protein [Phycisphaerae bacterium]HPP19360.1 DUF4349 domain-containing protein [Phycisphaerae bacterium]